MSAGDKVTITLPKDGGIMDGVDGNLLRLSATLSSKIYENNPSKNTLQERLSEVSQVKEKFPNLKVHFCFHDGHIGDIKNHFSRPPFAAITTGQTDEEGGNTLILVWRGSSTAMDWITNFRMKPDNLETCGEEYYVQGACLSLIKQQFNIPIKGIVLGRKDGKGNDLVRLIETGNHELESKGKPVKRIILTGHSLGGGMAQVAHVFLKSSKCPAELSEVIAKYKVKIHTVAFSAPMSIALKDKSAPIKKIEDMVNFVYNMDIFPRLYDGRKFADEILKEFNQDGSPLKSGIEEFVKFHFEVVSDVLERYRHFGKIVYYGENDKEPQLLENSDDLKKISFEGSGSIKTAPDVVKVFYDEHMHLIHRWFGLV